MSIISTEFPLIFPEHDTHLNKNELNAGYGKQGRTYENLNDAHTALIYSGFLKTKNSNIWKNKLTGQLAYISNLRKSKIQKISSNWNEDLRCDVEIYDIDGYLDDGILVTFSGNQPYIKV